MKDSRSLRRIVWLCSLACLLSPGAVFAQSKPLSGSYGFLITTAVTNPATDGGGAVLGVMNLDGAGNLSGSYDLEIGSAGSQTGQSVAGSLTGTYSNNPDGTGTVTLSLDAGVTITFAMVITDGGQGLQLVATSCGGDCDITGDVISGVARAAHAGPLKGSYGVQLSNYPKPFSLVGVTSFDGSGNIASSFTAVAAGQDPNQAPTQTASNTGTYSINPDGSGTMNFADGGTYVFVVTNGGAVAFVLQKGRPGNGVEFGTARLQ